MGPIIQVNIPDGIGEIMESLTMAILKTQPNDIYRFAVVHLDSLIQMRRAQSSGLSPSPTAETGQKASLGQDIPIDEELKNSVTDEKPLEEPESNDTSYGVEATAVRTLAASTGTVAILGTTAKVKELNEPAFVENKPSPTELAINGEKVKKVTSNVLEQGDTIASSETNVALITDSANPLTLCLEKQCKEEGILERKSDLQLPETQNIMKDREANNVMKEEKIFKEREGEVKDKVDKGEVEEKQENKKEAEHVNEILTKEGKVDTYFVQWPDEIEISAMNKSTTSNSTNVFIEIQKEPVRIVEYQEKKDRAHEPKIVEEMSVKKEENMNKVNHPDFSLKKEEVYEKIVSIEKQESEIMNEERPIRTGLTNEVFTKTTPESEPISLGSSKIEEEENEISSEQLKTNSLSDMSLSENLNSEGEEAAREAAKALELKEMVASLSATANRVKLDYEISGNINNPKDVPLDDTTVSPTLRVLEIPEPVQGESSISDKVPEEKIEENVDKSFEIPQMINELSSEKEPTVSIPETSDETIAPSENYGGEKELSRLKESLEDSVNVLKIENSEYNIQKKENYEIDLESQNFEGNKGTIAVKDTTVIETAFKHKNREIQESWTETKSEEKGEVNEFKKTEAELKNDEERENFTETKKSEHIKKNEHGDTYPRERPDETSGDRIDHMEVEEKKQEKENEPTEKSKMNENIETIAAATIIQSGFRGYKVRKHLKQSEAEDEVNQMITKKGDEVFKGENKLLNGALPIMTEMFYEKGPLDKQEKDLLGTSESKTSETEEKVKHVPESLIKIAQAEVDKICKEAEKATESIMTPPLVKNNSESDIQEEEFPAPPDELLISESQNEEIKEDKSSSGTQSTEPTMPLGSNHTEGDYSKTEDTTAPSLAESEIPKTAGQSPSLQNDDFRLESSVTENINTEIAMQRDSTEGELTMEDDSTREDDVLAPSPSDILSKADGEESLTPEEEKAATVIQAGYRGFKARKRLREELSTETTRDKGTVEQMDFKSESSGLKSSINYGIESNSSNSLSGDKSEKELNDSAKKIQAGVRGYLVRKKQKLERDAAVTIQSHFRGFKTRQRLKHKST